VGGWVGGPGGGPGGERKGGREEGGKERGGRGEKPRHGRFCGLPGLCESLVLLPGSFALSRSSLADCEGFCFSFLFWRLVKPSLHSPDCVQFLSVGIDDLGS
jgi:hypothetical protein